MKTTIKATTAIVSAAIQQPTSLAPAASGDDPGQDGDGDLRRRDGADIEANRALDAADHVLGDAFGAKGVEVMPGVAVAADQADEARIPGQEDLEGPDQVGSIVVGVHRIDLLAKRRVELVEVGQCHWP